MVTLTDGETFGVSLTGAAAGRTLASSAKTRPSNHLSVRTEESAISVVVYPEVLLVDFERAILDSGLLKRGLALKYLERTAGSVYSYDRPALEGALLSAGLPRWEAPVDRRRGRRRWRLSRAQIGSRR
jgi:hypothetical protein